MPDISRNLRFVGKPALVAKGVRFYAGAPLRAAAGHLLGTQIKLLEAMAVDVMALLQQNTLQW